MFLTKMIIKEFRNLRDIEFNFGKNLTLIAGRNGTSKTSLLGLIVQPFKFEKNLGVTLFGAKFDTDFSELHKITEFDEDDKGTIKKIIYQIEFKNDNISETLPVRGYTEKPQTKDKRHRFKAGKAQSGQGNKTHPTIYLGLKRLIPLGEHTAEDSKIPQTMKKAVRELIFSEEEIKFYEDVYTSIFIKYFGKTPAPLATKHKNTIGANMGDYDSRSFSAGQDNFGQIIGAIISFQRLKEKMGENYRGGIICIDEVETTFHPIALKKLFEFLRSQSTRLNLQIIMTTHSLQLLKLAYEDLSQSITNVVYLSRQGPNITVKDNLPYHLIESDMFLEARTENFSPQIYLICEDDEAKFFLENILLKELQKRVNIIAAKLGGENLEKISSSGLKDIANLIFILDGDKKVSVEQKILVFPCNAIPERILYEVLEEKYANDTSFWQDQQYSSDIYFQSYEKNPYNEGSNYDKKTRVVAKNFFNNAMRLSREIVSKAFSYWIEQNQKDVEIFNTDVQNEIEKIIKESKKPF